jgi:bifunctional non-homologous end joining protein LigD
MVMKIDGLSVRHRIYAIKKHDATRLHYDLRLEWNGVLLSWAIPLGPSCCVGVKRKAVEMEDHNREYISFEGVHHTGTIMLWDVGTWEPHPACEDIERSLCDGYLRFILHGGKLKGEWLLVRADDPRNSSQIIWWLTKQADEFVALPSEPSILEMMPNGMKSGRTMEEIARQWATPRKKHGGQTNLFLEDAQH